MVFQMSMDLPKRTHLGMLQGLFSTLSTWLQVHNVPLSESGIQLFELMKKEQEQNKNDNQEWQTVNFQMRIPMLLNSIQVCTQINELTHPFTFWSKNDCLNLTYQVPTLMIFDEIQVSHILVSTVTS